MPGADHDTQPGCAGAGDHALRVIAAERHAAYVLEQVRLGKLDAEGLALALARMYGAELRAMSRALCKTLQGTSDARP